MAIAKKRSAKTMHPVIKSLLLLIAAVSFYFVCIKAVPKLFLSETTYGDYYWYRAPWLFIHNIFGIVALLTGPLQLLPSFRNKHWKLHRNLGKVYLLSVLIASVTSIYLSLTSAITYTYMAGLLIGSVAWLVTAVLSYISIRKRKVQLHKRWMIRNYILTFFFIIFFGFYDLFRAGGVNDHISLASILPWVSLVVPMIITEIYLRRKK
jgi:uncharacterized membrane protein